MNDIVKEIKSTAWFQKVQKNPFLFNLLKFFLNDVIIRLAKDLLDDGRLNNSVK